MFSASSEARDRNTPTNANQIRLQTSRIRQEHRPIRYQLPARLSFRQGQGSTSSGGESGLNLFINDVKKIQVVDPPPLATNIPYARAGTPSRLLVRGAISQVEFDGLKAKLLGSTSSP